MGQRRERLRELADGFIDLSSKTGDRAFTVPQKARECAI
jgi:hypothetical protein